MFWKILANHKFNQFGYRQFEKLKKGSINPF